MTISSNSSGLRPGVCDSTTRPTSPYEGQMIYETDTDKVLVWNGTTWYPSWNLPWGSVAYLESSTSGTILNAETTLLTLSFDSVANRRYRISYHEPSMFNSNTAVNTFHFRINGTGVTALHTTNVLIGANWYVIMNMSAIATFATGTQTIYVRASEPAATGTSLQRAASSKAYILVEDIGPL
jgi:hypothetical protein